MDTGLLDLLHDGGYTDQAVETYCKEFGITQQFIGITGTPPPQETLFRRVHMGHLPLGPLDGEADIRKLSLSLAEFAWDGHELLACPAGHEPLDQSHSQKGRISFRMAKDHCEECEYQDRCYVEEKQQFYTFGFWERKLEIVYRRARLDDSASQEFLN